ncbi:MAG: DedA family protein [Caulobacteraceae bacterium]|nr:DedA family protein [Caulobacteraceae bacterium]
MIRALYNWTMRLADSRHALWAMFAVSFAESSFFPVPPDVVLAPMILKKPQKAYFYAAVCTLASVLGGMLGYAIGYYLEDLGRWLLALTGHAEGLAEYQKWYAEWGAWVILAKGVTPIPYKLVTIASGIAHYAFGMFIVLSVITRGARFFLTAIVLKRFGPKMLEIIEKRLVTVAVTLVGLIVLGLLMARYGNLVVDLFR